MRFHVPLVRLVTGQSSAAHFTITSVVALVRSLVPSQGLRCAETLQTLLAFVWLLPVVRSRVLRQRVGFGETHPAHVAPIRFLSGVQSPVPVP